MPTAAAKETAVVTKVELSEIAKLETDYAKAKRKVIDTEKDLKFHRIQLAEKVLGVKSQDELKALSPAEVQKRMEKRFDAGDWKAERGAPEFQFVKSSSGSYPAWAKLFVQELGETAAARIKAETDVTYSYCVEVTL
ncbi:MAG TPA: hypothetical protein VFF64_06615 [Candidatus Eremiobacteraceae bacterium]|nr:hypothetical protein [Candidatus Eremiobacteraceae bacterium]